jgi:hypothetical protein
MTCTLEDRFETLGLGFVSPRMTLLAESYFIKKKTRMSPGDGGPELNCAKLNDHTSVSEKSRMNPVMTIRHTENVHIECVLLYRPSGNLAFSWKNLV